MNATMKDSGTSSPLRNKKIKKGYEIASFIKAV
jgi:hypothetical protein